MSTERYKNGLIYKLVCNDTSIKENYIGSCCNFYKRKNAHKTDCNNININAYNSYKYKFIREHGGFNNWSMIVIKEFPCNSKRELQTEERIQLEINGGELNSQRPVITNKEQKEYQNEYSKQYYHEHKEEIKEKLNQKYDCACGGKYTYTHKARHLKTKKHTDYLNDIND